MKALILALATLALGLVAACGEGGKNIKASDYASKCHSYHTLGDSPSIYCNWVLMVEEATLHCEEVGGGKVAVWVEDGKKHYPMNGFARTILKKRGQEPYDIDQILRHSNPAAHLMHSPLYEDTIKLCG